MQARASNGKTSLRSIRLGSSESVPQARNLPAGSAMPARFCSVLLLALVGMALPLMPARAADAVSPPAQSASGPVFSIDDLVRLIIKTNPGLLTSQRALEIATAGITTAGALPNPRLEWNTGRSQAAVASGIGGPTNGMGVSQLIENPVLRSARLEAARQNERGSVHFVASTRNELVAQIKVLAYEYLLRKEEVLAAADALALLEQIRERVKVRVETGEAGRYELIKADAEIINASARLQTAKLQVDQARLGLNRLAAGNLPASWSLSAALGETVELPSLQAIEQSAQQDNPELRVLQAELDRSLARIDEATASRWPGVELRYTQMNEPDVRQNMFGIALQVPLLDQRTGPRAEAIGQRERARTRLEGRRAELSQQLALAWNSVDIARNRIDALSQGAVRQSEAALRVAEAAYRFGERGILDVLDAQRVLSSVNADLLKARFALQASTIELNFLAGRYANGGN